MTSVYRKLCDGHTKLLTNRTIQIGMV